MKMHCRKYCRILTQVIKETKYMHYNKQILGSYNKVKAVRKTGKGNRKSFCRRIDMINKYK
jgi:hypothetical protein